MLVRNQADFSASVGPFNNSSNATRATAWVLGITRSTGKTLLQENSGSILSLLKNTLTVIVADSSNCQRKLRLMPSPTLSILNSSDLGNGEMLLNLKMPLR